MATMRTFVIGFLAFGLCCTLCAVPEKALAESKFWVFGWPNAHWKTLDYEQRYMRGPVQRHSHVLPAPDNTRLWHPSDWTNQRGRDTGTLVRGWQNAGIIADYDLDEDVPLMEVGSGFYRLSDTDKSRVLKIFAAHTGIIWNRRGILRLRDARTGKVIGMYTAHGLMLR